MHDARNPLEAMYFVISGVGKHAGEHCVSNSLSTLS
jgi:hypothetical protein